MDDQNAVVLAAKSLSYLLQELSHSIRHQDGPISSKNSLFTITDNMREHCHTLMKFTEFIRDYSLADQR